MNKTEHQVKAYHQELDRALLSRIDFEQRRHHSGSTSKEYLNAATEVVQKIRIMAHSMARKHGADYVPTSLELELVELPSDLSTRRGGQHEQ